MKRYVMVVDYEYGVGSRESASGDWVRWDDVEALRLELERCVVELKKLADASTRHHEAVRLDGKVEGVELALEKLRRA